MEVSNSLTNIYFFRKYRKNIIKGLNLETISSKVEMKKSLFALRKTERQKERKEEGKTKRRKEGNK